MNETPSGRNILAHAWYRSYSDTFPQSHGGSTAQYTCSSPSAGEEEKRRPKTTKKKLLNSSDAHLETSRRQDAGDIGASRRYRLTLKKKLLYILNLGFNIN